MCWDEENRLSAIHDCGEMSNLSVYLYDDAGERAWKLTGDEMQVQVNGQTMYSSVILDKTLYASPYLVMDEHEYTKHYYIEGERVCSKIGSGFGPATVLPTSTPLNFIVGDESDCTENLKHLVYNHLECTDYNGDKKIYVDLQPAYNTNNDFEDKQYFYHPDHLGSSSFITNALGKAEQHMQYLPFGELWINQRNSEFDSPYKFSAKELDSESGYNYFGARYYDSEASIWLSVDPMANARSWVSPYSYVQNSPVMRVDPTGALDDDNTDGWELDIDTQTLTWKNHEGGDNTQHISLVYNDEEIKSIKVDIDKKSVEKMGEILTEWEKVGHGIYLGAGWSILGGAEGSTGNFQIYSQPESWFSYTDGGGNYGYDFGAGGGVILIFGPPTLQGNDIEGYGAGFMIGKGCIEAGLQTSATSSGKPTFNYAILSIGLAISVDGGGITLSRANVTEHERIKYEHPMHHGYTCFAENTLIWMKDGYKRINEIEVGDSIISYNIEKKELVYSMVTKKYIAESDSIYVLDYSEDEIFVTAHHPFFVKDKGWVEVKELKVGDKLIVADNDYVVLNSIQKIAWSLNVYNIEVDKSHNYFVMKKKILVHNK